MRRLLLLAAALLPLAASAQTPISIAAARATSLGTTVTVKGIVTNGPELGVIRYIQDNTGGIGVYDVSASSGINEGDSILVTGVLFEYNQLLEISPVTSYTVLSSGHPLPDPVPVSISTGFNETYEGRLVTVGTASFTDAGAFSGSSANYEITDAGGVGEVRVNGTTNIAGTAIPTDPVDITGIMSQFDFSSPVDGYQLLPRSLSDFDAPGNPPVISTPLTQSNLATTGFTVSFETLEDGNTILYYGTTEALGSVASDAALTTTHSLDLSGLSPGTIYFVQGASVSATGDTSYSPVTPMATVSTSSGAVRVWFNNPVDNSVAEGRNAVFCNMTLDDSIKSVIDGAQNTLDIAIYNLDNENGLVDAINAAYARGVTVRLVADNGVNSAAYNALSIGGAKRKSPSGSAPSGGFYGLMHNKFIVADADDADNAWVLTGSTNWTDNQLLSDPNNVILLQDQSLARAYRMEFEEMYNGTWGPEKTANTPQQFLVGGMPVELYFSASDNVETRIRETIATADNDLHLAVYNWTRFNISFSVEDAVDAGAFAAGIIEDIDTMATEWTVLREALGPNLFLDNTPGLFHHKYALIDARCPAKDPIVLTGSSNFTGNGTARSDENILVVHSAEVANLYYQEWVARYDENGGSNLAPVAADCAVDTTSGIGAPAPLALRAWPNPATDLVRLELPEGGRGAWTLTLADASGRVLRQDRLPANAQRHGFSVRDLPAGLYLVRLADASGRLATGRLAVTR
jgi:hypothetical protein